MRRLTRIWGEDVRKSIGILYCIKSRLVRTINTTGVKYSRCGDSMSSTWNNQIDLKGPCSYWNHIKSHMHNLIPWASPVLLDQNLSHSHSGVRASWGDNIRKAGAASFYLKVRFYISYPDTQELWKQTCSKFLWPKTFKTRLCLQAVLLSSCCAPGLLLLYQNNQNYEGIQHSIKFSQYRHIRWPLTSN